MRGLMLLSLGEGHGDSKPHGELLNDPHYAICVTEVVVGKDLRKPGRVHT